MPKTKVANPRDKRELHISRGVEEVDADHEEWLLYQQQQQPHTQSGRVPMLSGLNREREMSAMVSALTHVVSGEVPFGFVDESDLTQSLASGSGSGSGSGSSIGVGHKRGRQEEAPSTRLSRAFDDFTLEGSSSSIRGKFPLLLLLLLLLLFFFFFFFFFFEVLIFKEFFFFFSFPSPS